MNLCEIKKAVKELDKTISPKSDSFRAAVYLLSACEVGPNKKNLAKFTGYSSKEIDVWHSNAKANGLFKGGKICHSGWDDKEAGGVAFWMDVLILKGLVKRIK